MEATGEPLHVAKDQENYVANTFAMMARAFAYREEGGKALLIYADDTPVGMVMYYEYAEAAQYIFAELLIDERYQRKGYGKKAAEIVLNSMGSEGKFSKVCLCYIDGNNVAKHLYESLGFVETGRDDDEIIMELEL